MEWIELLSQRRGFVTLIDHPPAGEPAQKGPVDRCFLSPVPNAVQKREALSTIMEHRVSTRNLDSFIASATALSPAIGEHRLCFRR